MGANTLTKKRTIATLKESQVIPKQKSEFPESYTLKYEIKSTLQTLHYNYNPLFEDNYPAKMHPDFARDMILWYSSKDDTVLDGCCGAGIVPRTAYSLGRHGMGFDVNPAAIELCKQHDPQNHTNYFVADSRELKFENKVDLVLSSLPFGLNIAGDKNHYSEEPADISNSKTYEKFFENAEKIIAAYFKVLKPNGIMILDARDRTKDGVYYDLISEFRNSAKKVGFKIMARYYYQLVPWTAHGFNNRDTKRPVPLIDTMDAIVCYKPTNTKLDEVLIK